MLCILLSLGLEAAPLGLVETIRRAEESLQAGRPVEALDGFRAAASHAEGGRMTALGSAQALHALAVLGDGDPKLAHEQARDAWLDVAAYQGFDSTVRRGLVEAYLGMGEPLAAAREWEQLVPLEPAAADLAYRLAPALLDVGEWDSAGHVFGVIATLEPGNFEAAYWAGALLMPTDQLQTRQFLMAARADPLYRVRAQKLLGALASLEGVDRPAQVPGRLGLAYLEVGQPALALPQFQTAIRLDTTFAEAWAYLGLTIDRLGEQGYWAAAEGVRLRSESPLTHSVMGHHWLWHGRPDLARPEYVAAWQLDPENPAHMGDIASTYQLEADLVAAEAWYQAAIRAAPDDEVFWVLLARFYLDTLHRVEDGGLLAAQKAVSLAPDDPDALDVLGWAQYLAGEVRLAETNLLAAQNLNPAAPSATYHLGVLYADQGRTAEATAALERTIQLDSPCLQCPSDRVGLYAQLAERALEELVH